MIGGRNGWIAWPAGVMCAGVVAGLVWLAAPGVPAAIDLVENTIQNAQPVWDQPATSTEVPPLTDDCRSLYPGLMWLTLGWNPNVALSQSTAMPVSSVAGMVEALQPTVLMTCMWRDSAGGSISTTLATVEPARAEAAQSTLVAAGFTCSPSGDGTRCLKVTGAVTQDDTLRDGMWLTTTATSWRFPQYTEQLIGRLWP